jgi:hypothetical protein
VELKLELELELEVEYNTSILLFNLTATGEFIYPGSLFFKNNKDVIINGVDICKAITS